MKKKITGKINIKQFKTINIFTYFRFNRDKGSILFFEFFLENDQQNLNDLGQICQAQNYNCQFFFYFLNAMKKLFSSLLESSQYALSI